MEATGNVEWHKCKQIVEGNLFQIDNHIYAVSNVWLQLVIPNQKKPAKMSKGEFIWMGWMLINQAVLFWVFFLDILIFK